MSYCKITHEYFRADMGTICENQIGETLLVSPNAYYKTCWDCGKKVIYDPYEESDFTRDNNGNVICYDCEQKDEIYTCDECGEFTKTSTIVYKNRREMNICDECLEDYYIACDICGDYTHISEIRTTEDNYQVCDNCEENGATYHCEDCGTIFKYLENMIYDEDTGGYYCETCFGRNEKDKIIRDYNYKPTPNFLKENNEEHNNEYFGFEIEVNGDNDYAEGFLETVKSRDNNLLYLKYDSSICGFEIVTHPMTREYIYNTFKKRMTKGLSYLRDKGFRGHNKAGIHIHVSRDAITTDMLKKMIILLYPKTEKEIKTWLQITQRKEGQMRDWCSMYEDCLREKDVKRTLKFIDGLKEHGNKIDVNYERHTAINTRNDDTIEFRIFNSNTRIERIIKNAEVIFSLIDFCKTDKLPHLNNYLRFIRENKEKYKILDDFLVEKNIYKQPEKEKEKQEILKVVNYYSETPITQKGLTEYVRNLVNENRFNEDNEGDEELCALQF